MDKIAEIVCPSCGHQKHIGSCYHLDTIENVPKECGCYISADQKQKHCTLEPWLKCGWTIKKEMCPSCPKYQSPEQPTPMPLIDIKITLGKTLGEGFAFLDSSAKQQIADAMLRCLTEQRDADLALIPAIRAQARREFADKIIKEVPDFRGREKFIAHIRAEGGIEK